MLTVDLEILVAILTSFMASSGFWLFVQQRQRSNDLSHKLLVGLAHDRITYLAEKYIERGWITSDEYENLCVFLYTPYVELGGNGSTKRLMAEVDKLPIFQKPFPHVNKENADVPEQ